MAACTERCAGEGELVFGSHQAWRNRGRAEPGRQATFFAPFLRAGVWTVPSKQGAGGLERVGPIIFASPVLTAGDFCFHLAEEWPEQFALNMRERFIGRWRMAPRGRPIFQDDKDRRRFLETLAEHARRLAVAFTPMC